MSRKTTTLRRGKISLHDPCLDTKRRTNWLKNRGDKKRTGSKNVSYSLHYEDRFCGKAGSAQKKVDTGSKFSHGEKTKNWDKYQSLATRNNEPGTKGLG